ncbi:general negative regulator of transcription subunit 1 [Apiospora arundinis]
MVPPPSSSQSHSRSGTFTPAPSNHPIQTGGFGHSPHPSQGGNLSAGASPSTSSPTTGNNSLTKIVVAQVFLLLTTLKDDTDRAKWDLQRDQLKKLINDNGMEVFSKHLTRLVTQNAATIFSGGSNRPSSANYQLLVELMVKISTDVDHAPKIAESIETGTEDIFRDFDLSTFMEHFKLDALEKTILALAFKLGSRSDLKTKADAILSTNFPTFVNIISRPDVHPNLSSDKQGTDFIAYIVDRYIQGHPPNFNAAAKSELSHKVKSRWTGHDCAPPMEVLASLDLIRVLGEKPPNALALYIQRTGADFTRDEETCLGYLQDRPTNIQLSEEQVSSALTYTTISLTPRHNPSVLVAALRSVLPTAFSWQDVVSYFDQRDPGELDASTIPGLTPTFKLEDYKDSSNEVQTRAAFAVKHPLVSVSALSAIFSVALHSIHASQSIEAKRLFQEVVVPNLDIFIVSAFGVPKPWPSMAVETLISLFEQFLHSRSPHGTFVMDSIWRKDQDWVKQRLVDTHALKPMDLGIIFEHVIEHGWLDELVNLPNGFGFDLAALAHAKGYLDLSQWARNNSERGTEIALSLLQFLMIKGSMELAFQRPPEGTQPQRNSTTLQVKTVAALLQIVEDFMPKVPMQNLITVQRHCIIVYPRLINFGEGYDDIIEHNSQAGNALPPQANARMEEHYKTMYGNEVQVKEIVETLKRYKHSREPLDQDVFACMIHGLFDEYSHYVDYPLEALATTAVLFGGIISHKLISDLPLKIGLGMILEAVKDHMPDESMYKFGLQALMQLFSRFREWPGFCKQLLQIPGLQGTEAWKKANEVVREHEEEAANGQNGTPDVSGEPIANGVIDDGSAAGSSASPFSSVKVDPPASNGAYEDPSEDVQDKIQFGLNNLTPAKLQTIFKEIQERLEERHHQWFASHLVEERAKMQPNYHEVYLDFVRLFQDKGLSAEVLRQTYISTARMLNSEGTMQNSTERTHLKHLGAWLGLLTIARDQPIKHRNIAFKQLLIEAHDTKRLIVVIPFVCKVLIQGARSTVYRPPNPWLMDILHLLIELYHNAELKLNLKFEIEVLCKDLNLDHKSIEPSQELHNRAPVEDVGELPLPDGLDTVDTMSFNGIGNTVSTVLSPHPMPPPTIPDLNAQVQVPPVSEMVITTQKLHDIVRTALSRALHDIIQPVVDRSVTIAAISTHQMVHKDFQTEPDENRIRSSAITMVKATAGSLALVTSKEPLRANITNYLRQLSSDIPQGLPEGTIIMCVNLNLDLACAVIEKAAEERAVPEIEELLETELENRRHHRRTRPNEAYVDPALNRWAMTIPHPYKLSPNMSGLNPEQMAIYEEFARQPRTAAPSSSQAHASSASDATRTIANEVLQEQFAAVPNLPTPAETPSLPQVPAQLPYPQVHQAMTNGRAAAHPTQMDTRLYAERVSKFLGELQRAATESREEHFLDLPRPHQVLDVVDALTQLIIRNSQSSEEFAFYAAEKICQLLFERIEQANTLFLESLVHVLELLLKISIAGSGAALVERVHSIFNQQLPENYFNLPLITALLRTDLLNLHLIDMALSKAISKREDGSLEFFERLLDLTIFNDRPVALFADYVRSLEGAWGWISEEPDLEAGQQLKAKLQGSGLPQPPALDESSTGRQDQYEYLFDEWIHLSGNQSASEKVFPSFIKQLRSRGFLVTKEDFVSFVRTAFDTSIALYEQILHSGASQVDGYGAIDALVKLIATLAQANILSVDDSLAGAKTIFETAFAVSALVLNHHHVSRGEHFSQRVFFRFHSMMLHQAADIFSLTAPEAVVGQDGQEVHHQELVLSFANILFQLNPSRYPGFAYSWLDLVLHRRFLPVLMGIGDKRGWLPFMKITTSLIRYLGDHLKALDVPDIVKDFVRASVKFLVIIQHDYPDFLAANHVALCGCIPPHATQLRNIILFASPRQEPGDAQDVSALINDYDVAASYLQENGLLELVEQLVQNGPSEDAIAHLTHAINKNERGSSVFGNVPVNTDIALVNAVVLYIGTFAVKRAQQGGDIFVSSGADMATLSLLAHEVSAEARYFVLSSIVDELRFPNPFTSYFTSALLELWGQDVNDPEETDIRQQLVRIILERFSGYWPQPWGLVLMTVELTKNDKYLFFDQPFIKSDREIQEQFVAIVRAA